jgi:hypothetical protein
MDAYFIKLRLAALEGLDAASMKWVLDKAMAKWKVSADKVGQRIWMQRIKWDRRELGLDSASTDCPQDVRTSAEEPGDWGVSRDIDQCGFRSASDSDQASDSDAGEPNGMDYVNG